MVDFLRAVGLAVAAGLALGVLGQLGPDLHPSMRWVVALGVPWLVTAFAAGALLGDRWRGALAGALALVVGTIAYYGVRLALGGGGPLGVAADILGDREIARRGVFVVTGWCAAAVAGGAVFGLFGALWRRGGTFANVAGTALVSGALVGESLLLLHEWGGRGRGAMLVLGAELALGAALPFLLARRRAFVLPALALATVFAVLLGVAEDGVRDALRGVGWRGA